MIVDKMLQGKDLIGEIEFFINNPHELGRMSVAAKSLGKPEAAHDIAQLALDIAK